MEKTRIGLPAGILGAIVILLFLFGGYTVGLLAIGYVLLCEKDESLKVSALTALAVALVTSAASVVIGLIPDLMGLLNSMLSVFDVYMDLDVLYSIQGFFVGVVSLARTVVMAGLAVMSFLGKPIQLPVIKKLIAE